VVTNILRLYEDPGSSSRLPRRPGTAAGHPDLPECHGERLRPESRRVTVAGRTIVQVSRLPLIDLAAWFDRLATTSSPRGRRRRSDHSRPAGAHPTAYRCWGGIPDAGPPFADPLGR